MDFFYNTLKPGFDPADDGCGSPDAKSLVRGASGSHSTVRNLRSISIDEGCISVGDAGRQQSTRTSLSRCDSVATSVASTAYTSVWEGEEDPTTSAALPVRAGTGRTRQQLENLKITVEMKDHQLEEMEAHLGDAEKAAAYREGLLKQQLGTREDEVATMKTSNEALREQCNKQRQAVEELRAALDAFRIAKGGEEGPADEQQQEQVATVDERLKAREEDLKREIRSELEAQIRVEAEAHAADREAKLLEKVMDEMERKHARQAPHRHICAVM